ncbi:MAG: RNA polymerase sigma factor [Pirellulaceae bacterium]|nr:sigma-70 family RNA polymerase sigma factor [Planctomycetales bacterium]
MSSLPPPDHEHDERALVERAVAGDQVAIGELLYLASDDLTKFIASKMPTTIQNVVDPDDVLQDTFSAACRDIANFTWHSDHSFRAWLKAIAEHRIQDAARALNRKKRGGDFQRVETTRTSAADSMMNLLDVLVTDQSTPLRRASRNDALRCMQIAIAELPEQYQEAIRLQFLEGKSHQEISEIMQRTPAAVHGLLKRAKHLLREKLGRASAYLSSR